jgi:recombination protein RecT
MTQQLTRKDKVMSLVAFLQSKKEAIDNVAQRAVTGDVLIKTLQVACSRNPTLADCTGLSLLNALICGAEFGLRLGPAGHFYILPFWNSSIKKNEATPVVGYRGLIELVTRDGDVAGVEARLVRERDDFVLQYGTDASIVHKPAMSQRGKIVGAYCVVTMPNGHKQFEFMSLEELLKIKARSPMGKKNKGPWKLTANGDDNDFGEMCRKSVTRRATKYVPIGVDAADLLARADAMDGDIQSITLNVEGAEEGLAERLEGALAAGAERRGDEAESTGEGDEDGNTQDEAAPQSAGDEGRDDEGHEAAQAEEAEQATQSLLDRLDAQE